MLARRKGNWDIWGHYFFLLRALERLAGWPSQVNHKHRNVARKGKGFNCRFYCVDVDNTSDNETFPMCGWQYINPTRRVQCQFKFLTSLKVPIKTITPVCGWIFSPLIHNLHSWSWGSKFQVVRVSGFGSLSLHLAWARWRRGLNPNLREQMLVKTTDNSQECCFFKLNSIWF